jgi:hypothetical protein
VAIMADITEATMAVVVIMVVDTDKQAFIS